MLKNYALKFTCAVLLLQATWWLFACNYPAPGPKAIPVEPTITYDSLKHEMQLMREAVYKQYITARPSVQDSLVKATRAYLLSAITGNFFTHWYNTPWNFYGNTRVPKQGTIACGYFVTTVLQDAGFNIPRTAWAQLASETMMKKMNPDVKRYSNVSMAEFEKAFTGKPDGLYIVGLDMHVGFISKVNGQLQFIHSSYYEPAIGVMSQALQGHNPLNDSKYRVLAEILHKEMVVNWILNKRYE